MSRTARNLGAAFAVCLAVVLAGCSTPAAPDIDPTLSGELRSSVVEVATAASTGDYTQALALLDALEMSISTAAAADDISAARLVTLQASIARTRDDLDALILASTPEPTPTTPDPVVVAPESVPSDPAPVSGDATGDTATDGTANGNSGTGNSNSNGKGNEEKENAKDKKE